MANTAPKGKGGFWFWHRMTRRGIIVFVLWFVVLYLSGPIFFHLHPTPSLGIIDIPTFIFAMCFLALLAIGILVIPDRYQKTS